MFPPATSMTCAIGSGAPAAHPTGRSPVGPPAPTRPNCVAWSSAGRMASTGRSAVPDQHAALAPRHGRRHPTELPALWGRDHRRPVAGAHQRLAKHRHRTRRSGPAPGRPVPARGSGDGRVSCLPPQRGVCSIILVKAGTDFPPPETKPRPHRIAARTSQLALPVGYDSIGCQCSADHSCLR